MGVSASRQNNAEQEKLDAPADLGYFTSGQFGNAVQMPHLIHDY
jgi:hypothetical protein